VTAIVCPRPDLQIAFFARLQELKSELLLDALLEVVAGIDIDILDEEVRRFVPEEYRRRMCRWGLRAELVFVVPCILEACPRLLGYYRLLLGFSQKEFYRVSGLAPFKVLEERGRIPDKRRADVPALCRALADCAGKLLDGVGALDRQSIHEMTLLTLGPQLRGSFLNLKGQRAVQQVFELIRSIVPEGKRPAGFQPVIRFPNAAGREITIVFGGDPDVSVREELDGGSVRKILAIEIKGGSDRSNVHNRLGEAEKSHQKARAAGYIERWTIVGVEKWDEDLEKLARKESPTTNRFFVLQQITQRDSAPARDFLEELRSRLGL